MTSSVEERVMVALIGVVTLGVIVWAHLYVFSPAVRQMSGDDPANLFFSLFILFVFYSFLALLVYGLLHGDSSGSPRYRVPSRRRTTRLLCQKCGVVLEGETCSNCGSPAPRCLFCTRGVGSGDAVLFECCGVVSHRSHIKFWDSKHFICPYCRTHWPRKVTIV